MTTTVVHCDRCGERIEAGRTLATLETGPLRDRWPTLDLCGTCAEALGEWIRRGAGPSGEATGAPRGV